MLKTRWVKGKTTESNRHIQYQPCHAIGDRLHVLIAAAAVAAHVGFDAVILAFIWIQPSGDGELNQIFMIAKKGNIKLYKPTSSTTVCTHIVWNGEKRGLKCAYTTVWFMNLTMIWLVSNIMITPRLAFKSWLSICILSLFENKPTFPCVHIRKWNETNDILGLWW